MQQRRGGGGGGRGLRPPQGSRCRISDPNEAKELLPYFTFFVCSSTVLSFYLSCVLLRNLFLEGVCCLAFLSPFLSPIVFLMSLGSLALGFPFLKGAIVSCVGQNR